jgi:MOSC domain-containing protein YiiM
MNILHQINISKGGVPKWSVPEIVVDELGLLGDKQKDKRFHGGPDRAVCLFSLQEIQRLQAEGHPIQVGSTGENFTLSMSDYEQLKPGSVLRIGQQVLLEVTSYAAPCKTIKDSFINEAFTRISQKLHPGASRLYTRVLCGGLVRTGDEVKVLASATE